MSLPGGLFAPRFAHRGLWSPAGPPENSLSAFEAACAAGYGMELDVRLSADGEAMVFHDDALERMTGVDAPFAGLSAKELGALPLKGGPDCIPTLGETFARVASRGMILVEIKTGPGADGPLPARVAELIDAYGGPTAVISFDPAPLAWFARHSPHVPRGLDAAGFADADIASTTGDLTQAFAHLIESAQPDFLVLQLDTALGALAAQERANGRPVLAWTVRSPEDAARVKAACDNFIFEGFAA